MPDAFPSGRLAPLAGIPFGPSGGELGDQPFDLEPGAQPMRGLGIGDPVGAVAQDGGDLASQHGAGVDLLVKEAPDDLERQRGIGLGDPRAHVGGEMLVHAGEDAPAPSLPQGPFGLVYADPPWAFRTFSAATRTPTQKKFNEAEDHYPTVTLDELKKLPVGDVVEKDSALAMWIVGSHCDAALELGRAWGFDFTTDLFYWLKQKLVRANQIDLFSGDIAPPKMSMGYYSRKQLESCWLFTRGKGLAVLDHSVRQLIIEPPREHSRKPAEAAHRLERLFGDVPRLEMFCRTPRAGWTSWGNEVGKFEEAGA